ncbi:hypothetical protein NBO_66g0054 [Nosema bombycis CQ1]|uniref:Uncharacterized protein n=1 Tax=Nosema bombycis (strain CQ1 / CVCC 102059) TaxID=578461 RepID=R0MHG7_NOSB1|nr:hypothetical protein NBO_66g0054 [Nosema bombycis CQ1]|eukprot:EOB13595.1 hypothetical protein NBO_66g0054 [Nosema bombycis CQ1]
MDDILAKLRKSNNIKEEVKENSEIIEDFTFESSQLEESDYSMEPTSSQCQTPFQINKLDFDKIKSLRSPDCITILEINKSQEYKIPNVLLCIIRKVIRFSKDAVCLELIDDTGTIEASCTSELMKEENFKSGIVLKIQNFSLWRINSNHINLVKSNLIA